MSSKNFLSIPRKLLFSSPQTLGKSPTKTRYYSPQMNKLSKNYKSNFMRKLKFESKHNSGECFHLNNFQHETVQQNSPILYLDSPTKNIVGLKGLVYPNKFPILGRGKFGITIKAMYHGQFIAVKIIKNQNHTKSIKNETNFIRIVHPNIVRLYGVILKHVHYYGMVLMEDCSAYKNLFTFLTEEKNVHNSIKKRIMLDVCNGVEAIHQENIVHLDLKPQNVLINHQQRIKICDFGSSFNLNEHSYTLFGSTVCYTAPELFLGKKPTKKCDIYSLGITFWEIKTQNTPYQDLPPDFIIYNVCKNKLRPICKTVDDRELVKICHICWAEDSNIRPTISELTKLITFYNFQTS